MLRIASVFFILFLSQNLTAMNVLTLRNEVVNLRQGLYFGYSKVVL